MNEKTTNTTNYKAAYERQKIARERAEKNLEDRSRELFEASESLRMAYNRLKDQKAHIIHQEKLATIGQLSAGIAHEINNPTGFVKSNLQSLKRYATNITNALSDIDNFIQNQPKNLTIKDMFIEVKEKWDIDYILEDIGDTIDESNEGIARIETIVKSLKNFSRPDKDTHELYSINECIENTLKLVSGDIKYHTKINVVLKDIPLILGNSGAMSQVILNLLVNAADAIKKNGIINISTYSIKEEIYIDVTDNGSGMPKELYSKVFDPFFTTKEVGHGTGLGLSISHGIIKKHGGRITVDSKENIGTTFSIILPIPKIT